MTLPRSETAKIIGILSLFLVLLLVTLTMPYTRYVNIDGVMMPPSGVIAIRAPHSAIVTKAFASEGSKVVKGEPLVSMSIQRQDKSSQLVLESRAEDLRKKQESVHNQMKIIDMEFQQELLATERRLSGLREQIDSVRAQAGVQAQKVRTLEDLMRKYKSLQEENFISSTAFDLRQSELYEQQGIHFGLRKTIAALNSELGELELRKGTLLIAAEQKKHPLKRELIDIQQHSLDTSVQQATLLTAPVTGTLTELAGRENTSMEAGQVVAEILPASQDLEVHLMASGSAIGRVSAGQQVKIRFQAYPYRRYGQADGRVVSVSELPSRATESLAPGITYSPKFKIKVKLKSVLKNPDGSAVRLQPGMTVQASIPQETRMVARFLFGF